MSAAEIVHKPDFAAKRKHFIFTDEHEALRESIRSFAVKELAPHAEEWEETTFPDAVFARMGELLDREAADRLAQRLVLVGEDEVLALGGEVGLVDGLGGAHE